MLDHEFQQMTQFANGCKIDHLPDRSITVLKSSKKEGVIIEMRRADPDPKFQGVAPSIFRVETKDGKNIEVTGVLITNEAAMALWLCLSDYFKRVEKLPEDLGPDG